MGSEISTASGDGAGCTSSDTPAVSASERRPPRDRRHGAGMLIRPHGGAETRVKSGNRAEAPPSHPDRAATDDGAKG